MKKNTAYTIGSLIILLICAFVFVILPAFTGSSSRQGETPVFGKYNGTEIRYEQNSDMYNFASNYAQMYQNYGMQIDSSNHYYIMNSAFNSTVMKIAYSDAVKNSGYVLPEEAINRGLRPYFADATGNYSSKIYKQTPASTIQSLTKSVSESLISQRFADDNFGSESDIVGDTALYGLKESDAELDFLTAYDENRRGFEMAVFPLSTYPEEEKIAYGKQNAAKFAKYDMSAITVADKSLAKTVLNKINGNEITFEDAVTEYSDKNYTNSEGKLTTKYQYQIENLLTNKSDLAKITDLSVNAVSEIIETDGNYTIFKNDSKKLDADFEDADTVRVVSTYLTTNEKSIIEDYFTAKAKELKAAAADDFEAACTKFNITKTEVAPFPLNYGSVNLAKSVDTSVAGLSNADTNENFLTTAFSLKMNEVSDPIVMNDNVVVIKYVSSENVPSDKTVVSEVANYDQTSAQNTIMESPKLDNNFATTYFKNFLN